MTRNPTAKESILKHGLMCRCPRCGKGRLFKGFLTLAPRAGVRTAVRRYPLAAANEALADLRDGRMRGAAVLVP